MASTTPTNVDTSIPELWAEGVLRDGLREAYFERFTGPEGSGAPIIQKTELLNKSGDVIHIQTTSPLAGAGISGDVAVLEGNEENLTTAELKVTPVLYRHGVRVFRRADKKSIIDLREEAKMRLGEWAAEKNDDLRFANFVLDGTLDGVAYVPNYHVAGGTDGTPHIDDVIASEKITVDELQKLSLRLYNQRAKPVRVDGKEYFIAIVHPNCLYDLKREAEYRDWVREAAIRGPENPFFKGATAIVDGIVIHTHNNVPTATNAGSVSVAKNLVFGAEAFVEGLDENVSYAEKLFDYDNEFGVALGFAIQSRRALAKNSVLFLAAATSPL